RDGAAMLALAAESKPVPSIVPQLIRLVARERADARWTSTQDESWMLLAARALKEGNNSITLSVNGAPHTGGYSDRVAGNDLVDSPLTIANTGTTALQAVVTAVAAPVEPLPAGGDGFTIDRTYYRLDGTEANITEARQNERYVVVLKVYEQNKWPSRLL
ncbi:MAG: hypothetical protein E5X98_18205, partial [Mesorhizobium sp.]